MLLLVPKSPYMGPKLTMLPDVSALYSDKMSAGTVLGKHIKISFEIHPSTILDKVLFITSSLRPSGKILTVGPGCLKKIHLITKYHFTISHEYFFVVCYNRPGCFLTHLTLVPHICFRELGQVLGNGLSTLFLWPTMEPLIWPQGLVQMGWQ